MDGFGRHHNVPEFLRGRKPQQKGPVPRLKELRIKPSRESQLSEVRNDPQPSEVDTPRLFEPNFSTAQPSDTEHREFAGPNGSEPELLPDAEVLRQQRELLASRERLCTRETNKDSHAASRGLLSRESKFSGIYRSQVAFKPPIGAYSVGGGYQVSDTLAERNPQEEVSFRDFKAGPVNKKPNTPVVSAFDIKSTSRAKLDTVNENTHDQNPSASHLELPYEHNQSANETKQQSSQLQMVKRYPAIFEQQSNPTWDHLKYQRREYKEMRTRTAGLQSSPARRFEFDSLKEKFSPQDAQIVVKKRQKPRLGSNLPSMKHLTRQSRISEKESPIPQVQKEKLPASSQKIYGLKPSASEPALKLRKISEAREIPSDNDRFQKQKIRTVNSGASNFFGGEPTPNVEENGLLETSPHVPKLGKQHIKLAGQWNSDISLPSLSKNSYSDFIRQHMGELPRLVDRRIAEKIMQENKQLRTVVTRDNLIIGMLAENLFV